MLKWNEFLLIWWRNLNFKKFTAVLSVFFAVFLCLVWPNVVTAQKVKLEKLQFDFQKFSAVWPAPYGVPAQLPVKCSLGRAVGCKSHYLGRKETFARLRSLSQEPSSLYPLYPLPVYYIIYNIGLIMSNSRSPFPQFEATFGTTLLSLKSHVL